MFNKIKHIVFYIQETGSVTGVRKPSKGGSVEKKGSVSSDKKAKGSKGSITRRGIYFWYTKYACS